MKNECKCKRPLINALKIKLALLTLCFFSIHQVTLAHFREIRCLENSLRPEDCLEVVQFLDSLKAPNYYNSTQCFERLANWTLYLKWKQTDSYALLKNRFRQIGGRTNLLSLIHNCFSRFRREVLDETIDDWGFDPASRGDGEKSNLDESFTKEEKDEKEEGQEEDKYPNTLRSRSVLSSLNSTRTEYPCLRMNPYIILGIIGFIFICACCSTLIIKRQLAQWCQFLKCLKCFMCCKSKNKIKKSLGKYSPIDTEKGNKSPKKRKASFSFNSEQRDDDSSKVLVNTATQDSNASRLKADEESAPSGCCKCCKKKKKKQNKRKK